MSPEGIRMPCEEQSVPDGSLLPHKLLSYIHLFNAYVFTQGTYLIAWYTVEGADLRAGAVGRQGLKYGDNFLTYKCYRENKTII